LDSEKALDVKPADLTCDKNSEFLKKLEEVEKANPIK
jgi:hypothetical protein